jgi:hypothetical protein
MNAFNLETISDPATRTEYKNFMARAERIAQSVSRAYGIDKNPIDFRFIEGNEFNAFAGEQNEAFLIEVNASVPFFNLILCSRLLSERSVLPFLDHDGRAVSAFTLPFVIDPAQFDHRADWQINLNEIRAFAASTIADMISTFVVCHEFGHIIGGHAGSLHALGGEGEIAELVSHIRMSALERDQRQAREYDADHVAASLLISFVEELVADCAINPRTRAVFSRADGRDFEHTLAILMASLFAFFTYVQGMRRTLNKHTAHPQPIVRVT